MEGSKEGIYEGELNVSGEERLKKGQEEEGSKKKWCNDGRKEELSEEERN